ncbi:MAG: hypothetical protein PHF18_14535 [Methanosarcina sp.]|nr:hypothetical protein [Methanosarcina sp.]MDD3248046.1 hypothetical protein [Methanosarcina sp.]
MKLSRRRLRKGLPPISFRRPCVMASGMRMDEMLVNRGTVSEVSDG